MKAIDILVLLAIGVTAHDFASYYGLHIPGLHAFFFSLPMIGILLGIKFERRVQRWRAQRNERCMICGHMFREVGRHHEHSTA